MANGQYRRVDFEDNANTLEASFFCGFVALLLRCSLVSMKIMGAFLKAALQNQRQDVSQHLTASHSIPPGYEDDPVHTMFTVSNNGSYEQR